MKVCNGMPSRIKTITGDGNCLFNSICYVLCSSEKFNWEIRQELCFYIERNWSKVGCLAGCLQEYKSGRHYLRKKKMRENYEGGGHVEMCALSFITRHDVLTYYMGGYYKFGRNKSDQCFFFYNPEKHYDVLLEP